MKKIIIASLMIFSIMMNVNVLLGQSTPPDPPGDPESGGGAVGGGAPIGGGTGILLLLGASYALKRIYFLKKSISYEELES